MSLFAKIAVPIPLETQSFSYRVPPRLRSKIKVGCMVSVPFHYQKEVTGYVVELTNEPPKIETRNIHQVYDPQPVVDAELLKLTRWIADYYFCNWGEAIHAAVAQPANNLPVQTENVLILNCSLPEAKEKIKTIRKNAHRQIQLLQLLIDHNGKITQKEATAQKISVQTIRTFIPDVIRIEEQEVINDPYHLTKILPPPQLKYNENQQQAMTYIKNGIVENRFEVVLLHGVTDSGKTEVYIETIREVLRLGKTAIVLVPEIALTPQMIHRFKSYFGNKVAVLHSRLSPTERSNIRRQIQKGGYQVVIGVRSAIFAPLKNLGLIVVDEEHESTYKQHDPDPRYHARDVAIMRAKIAGAMVVLGSATPSLESYYNAKNGKYTLLELPCRIHSTEMPPVALIDMRQERTEKGLAPISQLLRTKIEERLQKNEQILILLNRRGFSMFVQCASCGFVPHCPECDITLTYHKRPNKLKCHYCGYQIEFTAKCNQCHSNQLKFRGLGTQRVEDNLRALFPATTRIQRMDLDTTRKKGAHDRILESFKQGEIDILLGTQMISKGLDFPNITLVGVISADLILNFPDFRASERTFQLLTQVAGRAGRSIRGGEVIVQTLMPHHYSIIAAKHHDYYQFYEQEIRHRSDADYPPYTRLIRVLFIGKDFEICKNTALDFDKILKKKNIIIEILGPIPAALAKIKRNYRWQIMLKGKNYKILHNLLADALKDFKIPHQVRIEIDVDPQNML